jgi:hypothetical protein
MSRKDEEKVWVIQWCIDKKTNSYEDWPGYSATPMTRNEMLSALEECFSRWPHYEFRSHNIHSAVERLGKFSHSIRISDQEN